MHNTMTPIMHEQPHILKHHYKQRTLIAFALFVLTTFIFLLLINVLPIQRIPSEWYRQEQLTGVAMATSGTITRGALEAKKTHQVHNTINHDYQGIPSKYLTSPTGLPLGNYVVMIDAGSSGSRVYVYQYKLPFQLDDNNQVLPNADASADILHVAVAEDVNHHPIVRKQEPGLSSFGSNPGQAFTSIEPLLSFAAENIPQALHARTPIYIMATAGLRLLSEQQRNAILDNVRAGLKEWSDRGVFSFTSPDQADMITGEQEGLYGWVALNYIQNRFGDLHRTYPTGGLDPHTYGLLPRLTPNQYREHFDKFQVPDKKTGKVVAKQAVIVDDNRVEMAQRLQKIALDKKKQAEDNKNNNNPVVDDDTTPLKVDDSTVALLEIGGGSAQVAFAIDDGQSSHPPNYVYKVDLNLLHCDYALEAADAEEGEYTPGLSREEQQKQNGAKNVAKKSDISTRVDQYGQVWPVGGHTYHVYTASFLGHGANAARMRYLNYLIDTHMFSTIQNNQKKFKYPTLLLDPCSIYGQAEIISKNTAWGKAYVLPKNTFDHAAQSQHDASVFMSLDTTFLKNNEILLVGTGDWGLCRKHLVELLPPQPPSLYGKRYDPETGEKLPEVSPFDKSYYPYALGPEKTPSRCEYHCPINDQYQPVLQPDFFANKQFFGFSEYWFLTRDVLRIEPHEFTSELFETMSKELCDIHTSKQHWGDIEVKLQNGKDFPESATEPRVRQQCFKGAWMYTMLHLGHKIPETKNHKKEPTSDNKKPHQLIIPVSSIEGSEVQWSLGAVLLRTTEQLKKDRGMCLNLARDKNIHGLQQDLRDATTQFDQDEAARLRYNDYFGRDAGWDQLLIVYFVICVLSVALAVLVVVVLFYRLKRSQDSKTNIPTSPSSHLYQRL